MMKQRANSKQHDKKSEIKVGDKVLCRQQRLKKHTPVYSNEILRVIKRKEVLVGEAEVQKYMFTYHTEGQFHFMFILYL